MPTKRLEKYMLHFDDHDDQESKDLDYGAQKEACQKWSKEDTEYQDGSFSGDWKPEED